jgi:putative methyltransferase (TIGR04325 family)
MNIVAKVLRRLSRPSETLYGYEHPELIEVIFQKTLAYEPGTAWSETAKTVLDFGGGCGLHYKEAAMPEVRWAVVETPAMARRAKELETDRLRFFYDIREAADWLGDVNLVHSCGALQFTPSPVTTLEELCGLGAEAMLWRRANTYLGDKVTATIQRSRLADNGPGFTTRVANKEVQYPATQIPVATFREIHDRYGYEVVMAIPEVFRFVRRQPTPSIPSA